MWSSTIHLTSTGGFRRERAGRITAYRDYYIWETEKPNRWGSWFGGSAWECNTRSAHTICIFCKKTAGSELAESGAA
ncbi:MAG: alpha-amylase family glycosyl hydrolase [Oscillospiraceae bacterium]